MPNKKASTPERPTRLTRVTAEKMVAGVCAGIAHYFRIDPTVVRLFFVLVTVMGGFGVLAYLILWLVMPTDEAVIENNPEQTIQDNALEMKKMAATIIKTTPPGDARVTWGILIMVMGIVLLLQNMGLTRFIDWGKFWPLLLIGAGLALVIREK